MALVEDMSAFLSTAEFAEEVLYTSVAEPAARLVAVIFDNGYQAQLDGMAAGAEPSVQCSVADLPLAAMGDTFLIRGALYSVVEPQPDGTGWQVLRLRRA